MLQPVFLVVLLLVTQTLDCGCEQKPLLNVLAVVNGVKVTRKDLSIDTRTQTGLLQDAVITQRAQELNRQINKVLLEAEAKRRGLTTAKLLEVEVTGKVIQPTEKDARAFYNQNKNRIAQRFDDVKKDILGRLKTQRETLRANEFANTLRAGAQISVSNQLVTPPTNEAELVRVFATVNGTSITSLDIEQALLPLIFQVQQQVYAFRKLDMDVRINDLLLAQEAKRLATTPQALIDQNVRTKVPIISEAQAKAFYDKDKAQFKGKFSAVKLQIMQYLQEQEERKLFTAYAEELRKGAAVQIYLTAPQPPDLRQLCCNPVD
jgi:hypothetical protein